MYTKVEDDIKVSVESEYIAENSDPYEGTYAFNYTIVIENVGAKPVQLIERHWVICSAGEQVAEVVGPGISGDQPILESGDAFEFTSGAVLNHQVGSMQGSYVFRSNDGKYIEIPIPEFDLYTPMVVH